MYTWDGRLNKSLIIAIYTLLLFHILYSIVLQTIRSCCCLHFQLYNSYLYELLLFVTLLSARLPNLTLKPTSYEYNRVFWRSR